MERWLMDSAGDIRSCADLKGVKEALADISRRLGFDMFLYAVKLPKAFTRISNVIISDYPSAWIERYAARAYTNVDPVVKHCFSSHVPYCWEAFGSCTEPEVQRFIAEARSFGLHNGISIGIKGFDGENALLSVAMAHPGSIPRPLYEETVLVLNALLPIVHAKVRDVLLSGDLCEDAEPLSARERECLLWSAEGKTAGEISAILGISESTVVFHLKNAATRLKVSNRNQAIAKAVLTGLVTPQYPYSDIPTYHI